MEFAVHYSHAAASLVDKGAMVTDRFKCPAWPDLIATVQGRYPLYVHFPLQVGWGKGDAMDTERCTAADWHTVEALRAQTDTPYINVHLEPTTHDHPHIPVDTTDPADRDYVADCLLRDLRAVIARFGAERVIVENVPNADNCLRPAYHPEVIRSVIESAGCGFLFDLSHARRAARALRMDAREYIAALPVDRTREIHLSGIQTFDDRWVGMLRDAGLDDTMIRPFAGRWQDHLPMTDADWAFTAWAMAEIRRGAWGAPWIVTFEYGGVGPLWEALTDADALHAQVPRLYAMIHGETD